MSLTAPPFPFRLRPMTVRSSVPFLSWLSSPRPDCPRHLRNWVLEQDCCGGPRFDYLPAFLVGRTVCPWQFFVALKLRLLWRFLAPRMRRRKPSCPCPPQQSLRFWRFSPGRYLSTSRRPNKCRTDYPRHPRLLFADRRGRTGHSSLPLSPPKLWHTLPSPFSLWLCNEAVW